MSDCSIPGYHIHCKYCQEPYPDVHLGWKSMCMHLRDVHPDVWESDAELREAAANDFGVR